jgi:hypothetical protein
MFNLILFWKVTVNSIKIGVVILKNARRVSLVVFFNTKLHIIHIYLCFLKKVNSRER